MNKLIALSIVFALYSASSFAAVSQTSGAGSAVTTIDASASFESTASLTANPYSEGGMLFSRTGLSFNNNGCGYAGCAYNPGFAGFSGNYMYGVGVGYFDIATTGGNLFGGLEFTVGTGFSSSTVDVIWEAYRSSVLVGSGSVSLAVGTVIGFNDASGFDTLRYTDVLQSGQNAPAFDTVHAQYVAAIPEPEIYAMMLAGLGVLSFAARRKKKLQVSAALMMR